MKISPLIFFFLVFCSCKENSSPSDENKLIGTWQLLSSEYIKSDTSIRNDPPGTKMIKIVTPSHFAFFHHDLLTDEASEPKLFTAGAGTYRFENNEYVESLEYCSYRPYEGKTFHFSLEFRGDTLIQSGIENLKDQGIGEENLHLVEKYIRVKP